MPKPLTPKQEAFCLAYIETSNASEAYRQAYDCQRMKPETVSRNAKALLDNNKIATRLAEIRQPVLERAQITLETHLNDLKHLRDVSAKEGKYGAAVQAEIARGKASGLYIDRAEVTGKDGGPIQHAAPVPEMTHEELIEECRRLGLPTKIFD
jgi:phage terminase small subunit